MKRYLYLVLYCAVLLLFSACRTADTEPTLCISELQSAGGESDWVELYNYGSSAVSLRGWYLSDDPDNPGKSALPAVTLQGGERLVLTSGSTLAFKLSAAGDTVILSNPQGEAVQTVIIPPSVPGVSYGCVAEDAMPISFSWYAVPTPGRSNTEGMLLGGNVNDGRFGVRINEFMCRNKATLYDSDGDYGDWIELYNESGTAVSLDGWSLTDDETDSTRWRFPPHTVIPAKGYLVVFCDGKDHTEGGEWHTDFRLGEKDDFVGLYNADGILAAGVTCAETEQDIAYACDDLGNAVRCRYPTPGSANAAKEVVL